MYKIKAPLPKRVESQRKPGWTYWTSYTPQVYGGSAWLFHEKGESRDIADRLASRTEKNREKMFKDT